MKDSGLTAETPRVFAIIQARMGSTRLPGKVLKTLAGRSMLSHVIERLQAARELTGVVVATTTEAADKPVVRLAKEAGVPVYSGSVDDVLGRFSAAAQMVQADAIARITADCPLIDPVTVDQAARFFLESDFDIVDEGPDKVLPRGLDVSVFSMQALLRADKLAWDSASREHVTPYLYQHPEEFKVGYYPSRPELHHPEWRLCVDEQADFRLLEEIYERLYHPGAIIDMLEVARLLQQEPSLLAINAGVRQKLV